MAPTYVNSRGEIGGNRRKSGEMCFCARRNDRGKYSGARRKNPREIVGNFPRFPEKCISPFFSADMFFTSLADSIGIKRVFCYTYVTNLTDGMHLLRDMLSVPA